MAPTNESMMNDVIDNPIHMSQMFSDYSFPSDGAGFGEHCGVRDELAES